MAMLLPFTALAGGVGCGVQEYPHDPGATRRVAEGPGNDPSAGSVIELGDVAVAKPDAVAFIHFGHSNMAGRARVPEALYPYFFEETDPHAFMFHVGKEPELALEPYTAADDNRRQGAGPGTPLVKQAAALAPDTYFISLGYGRSAAKCPQYLPGGLYYDAAMAGALAIKGRVTFGAILIMLGIAEYRDAASISGFPDCIARLATAIRDDVGQPDLPVLLSDYEQNAGGELSVDSPFARAIIPEIRRVPDVVSNSAVVPTDGVPMQDDHHFNMEGHMLWTQRALQIMQDRGWFPWERAVRQ